MRLTQWMWFYTSDPALMTKYPKIANYQSSGAIMQISDMIGDYYSVSPKTATFLWSGWCHWWTIKFRTTRVPLTRFKLYYLTLLGAIRSGAITWKLGSAFVSLQQGTFYTGAKFTRNKLACNAVVIKPTVHTRITNPTEIKENVFYPYSTRPWHL